MHYDNNEKLAPRIAGVLQVICSKFVKIVLEIQE